MKNAINKTCTEKINLVKFNKKNRKKWKNSEIVSETQENKNKKFTFIQT